MKKLFCKHNLKPLEFVRNLSPELFKCSASLWKCPVCGKEIIRYYRFEQGEVSDGYHTFHELYHHRTMLFATICNENSELAWKSKKHNDDKMYDGMFIAGINTPKGIATYHCNIEPYWNLFKCKEIDKAPPYDGHTPSEAIERIYSLTEKKEKK